MTLKCLTETNHGLTATNSLKTPRNGCHDRENENVFLFKNLNDKQIFCFSFSIFSLNNSIKKIKQ